MTVSNTSTTVSEETINFSVNGKNIETIKVPKTGLSATTYKVGNITAAGQIGLNFDGTQNTNTLDLSSVTQDVDVDVFGDGQVKVTIHVTSSTEYVILAEGVSDVILGKGVNNNVIFSQSGSLVGSLKAAPGTDLNATNFKLSYAADFAGDIVINNTDAAQADDLYDALSAQNADDSWVSFEGFSFNLIDLKSTEDKGLVFSDNIVFGVVMMIILAIPLDHR